jgi:hypothetical protein
MGVQRTGFVSDSIRAPNYQVSNSTALFELLGVHELTVYIQIVHRWETEQTATYGHFSNIQ